MGRGKKYQPEQVVNLLRQIEVAIANGKTTALACKEAGIVEQTYFRWRKEYGGLQVDQAKRLKELEQENSKLKRVERIWRREGLKVPQKQKPRGRLWLNDGSCVRLRPERRNHVWSYDFVSARTHDGRSVRLLNLIDEHTRESLLVRAERRWSSSRVISALADVMVMKGVPEHLRSDNGPEFVAKDLRKWLAKTGAKTLYIEPGSPWENGCCESFNSKLRDEFLNGEIFYSIQELRVLAERWRVHYNTIRPHSSLGYRSPAPEKWLAKQYGAWRSGKQRTLPTSPHPRRRLLELRNSCLTLTHPTAQKIGHSRKSCKASYFKGLFLFMRYFNACCVSRKYCVVNLFAWLCSKPTEQVRQAFL